MDYLWQVLIGVGSALVVWLLTFKFIKPSIAISPKISRRPAPEGDARTYVYRVKFRNRRRSRRAVDLAVSASLSIKGVWEDREENRAVYDVPVDISSVPRIKPQAGRVVWLVLPAINKLPERVPQELRTKFQDSSIRLEELLALEDAVLRFFVRSNDSFTGAPLLAEKEYRAGCVVHGTFFKHSVEIDPGTVEGYERDELRT